MALKHRIGRLEIHRRASARLRCPECGHAPGEEVNVEILPPAVVRTMDELAAPQAETDCDRCSQCRRRPVYQMPSPRLVRVGT